MTDEKRKTCKACDEEIRTMIFRNEDYCSDECRKWLEQNGDLV